MTFPISAWSDPPDPWAAAEKAVAALDWTSARRQFAELARSNPRGSTEWTKATFGLAVALPRLQPVSTANVESAKQLFESVRQQSTDPRFVAAALMQLGRLAEASGDQAGSATAQARYEEVMRRWPNEPIGSEAALRSAALRIKAFDAPAFPQVRAGIALLQKWAAAHPTNPYAGVMWEYAADANFFPLADYRASLRCYAEVDRLGWADPNTQGPAYWRCARLAETELHDRETAVRYYTALIVRTPSHPKVYAAAAALRRLNAPVPATPLLTDPKPAIGETP